ncbi:MAG: GlsB/YeaQ/YmgE family stress response membrane protein [Actinomycetota bacterium]|nr:GlsB/YeaQ/YmgE family stress response membrane protein [Actinomycetota bacterium]
MGDVLSTIVWGLVAGIIIGPLARLVLPGKQNISLMMTILIGAVGAIAGGFIADAIGVGETSGIDWIKLAIQVGVAAVAVVLYGSMAGRKTGGTAT